MANDNGKGNGKNNAPVGNEDLESIVAEAVIETEKNTGNGNSNGNSNGNANGSSNGNNGNGKANANSNNENTSDGVSEVLEDTPGEDIPEVLEETTMLESLTENSEDDIEYIAKVRLFLVFLLSIIFNTIVRCFCAHLFLLACIWN